MRYKVAKLYVHWDVVIWRKALDFWMPFLDEYRKWHPDCYALEVGARKGGMALFLAQEYGVTVLCTDERFPREAEVFHRLHSCSSLIRYGVCVAPDLSYETDSFDIVILKSVLGAIGRNDRKDRQAQSVEEFRRVLKPRGLLLFAENLRASAIHRFARTCFRSWTKSWRYITVDEMTEFTRNYSELHYDTTGFLTNFATWEPVKFLSARIDHVIEPIIPVGLRYVIYGCAIK